MEYKRSFSERIDNFSFGLITGLVLPPVGFLFSYLVKYYPRSFSAFWSTFITSDNEQTQIFTLSMIPSLLLFYFILFRWKLDYGSRSFVGASLLYVVAFVIIKFFITTHAY